MTLYLESVPPQLLAIIVCAYKCLWTKVVKLLPVIIVDVRVDPQMALEACCLGNRPPVASLSGEQSHIPLVKAKDRPLGNCSFFSSSQA